MSTQKSIYIAGPMRGYECYNFEQFFYWAAILRTRGYKPVNPAETDCRKMLGGWVYSDDQYPEILLHDLTLVKEVDAIFLLEGWEKSPGARAELAFAKALNKEIILEEGYRGGAE